MLNKEFYKKYRFYIYGCSLIVIAIISHAQWFNPASILESGDWQYRFTDQVKSLFDGWGTWVKFGDLGVPNIQLFTYPIRGILWASITNLGMSYDIATKITLLVPIALGSFLFPYFAMYKLTKSAEASFVSSLFYGTTTYLLIIETRHLFIALVYVMAPLIFYMFKKALNSNSLKVWVSFLLVFTLGIFYELRIMYIVSFILALYVGYLIFMKQLKIKKYLKLLPVLAGLLILLNLFWIIPTTSSAGQEIEKTTDRGLFGNNLFDVPQAFTIFRWSWTGGVEDRAFTVQPIEWYLWIIPIVVILGLTMQGRRRVKSELLFFSIVALAGLILTKQSSPPISGLYLWLFGHIPGFALFREASKFYLVTAFAYWGLLGYGFLVIKELNTRYRQYALVAVSLSVVVVALVNLRPLITQEIGALFVSRSVPKDYSLLQSYITKQPTFFRTLWMPYTTSWGVYDTLHPAMSAPVMQAIERNYEDAEHYKPLSSDDQLIASYKSQIGQELLRNMSVKYVIVPLQEKDNYGDVFAAYGGDNDVNIRQRYIHELSQLSYLKRVEIGTKDVAVFENKSYKDYVQSLTTASSFNDSNDAGAVHYISNNFVDSGYVNSVKRDSSYLSKTIKLFSDPAKYTTQKGSLGTTTPVKNKSTLYLSEPRNTYAYEIGDNGSLSVLSTSTEIYSSSSQEVQIEKKYDTKVAFSTPYDLSGNYFFDYNGSISPLNTQEDLSNNLGSISSLELLKTPKQNLVDNGQIIKKPGVGYQKDCTLDDSRNENSIGPHRSDLVSLSAVLHTTCKATNPITLNDQSYIFSFDYLGSKVDQAGVAVEFDDPGHTTIKKKLPVEDKNWHAEYMKIFRPKGAEHAVLKFYAYKNENATDPANLYASIVYSPIIQDENTRISNGSQERTIALAAGQAQLTYKDQRLTARNLIKNSSLESGLWQKNVGDCNATDDKPKLRQALDSEQHTSGGKSLRLEAAAHTACTGPDGFAVSENNNYSLSFDYKAVKGLSMGYRISYDDPLSTSYGEKIMSTQSDWSNFHKVFRAPIGAHNAKLSLYAYSDGANGNYNATYYDSLEFMEIPDIENRFYIYQAVASDTAKPKQINYSIKDSTHTNIHISSATKPFYLSMAESYHDRWKLAFDKSVTNGYLAAFPSKGAKYVADERHFQLNDFANGWYIDPADICNQSGARCKHNTDNSYDIDLVAEFTPQRWFNLGLLVSTMTFVGCTAYLVYVKCRSSKKGELIHIARPRR